MAQKKVAVRVEELAEPLVKAAGMELVGAGLDLASLHR